MRTNRAGPSTVEKRPVKEGMRKDSIHPNVGGKVKNMVGADGPTPVDVHPHVFDPKEDGDLVPMIVDNVGSNNEGEKTRDKVTGRVAANVREIRKVRSGAGEVLSEIVKEIMGTRLTIEVGKLLEIAPGVRQGLAGTAQGRNTHLGPSHEEHAHKPMTAAVFGDEHVLPSGRRTNPKASEEGEVSDALMEIEVHIGNAIGIAIIDTGSQLNLQLW